MKASAGGYARAVDVPHALELMAGSEGAGRFLAGGQSLIAAMNMRLSEGERVISCFPVADEEDYRIFLHDRFLKRVSEKKGLRGTGKMRLRRFPGRRCVPWTEVPPC